MQPFHFPGEQASEQTSAPESSIHFFAPPPPPASSSRSRSQFHSLYRVLLKINACHAGCTSPPLSILFCYRFACLLTLLGTFYTSPCSNDFTLFRFPVLTLRQEILINLLYRHFSNAQSRITHAKSNIIKLAASKPLFPALNCVRGLSAR